MNMNRGILYGILILAYILITFFGLGPVLFADGSTQERILTLIAVLGLYAIVTATLIFIRKNKNLK
jgi:hypothetical protein